MIILAPFYKDTNLRLEGSEVNEMSQIFDYKQNLIRMYETFKKFNPSKIWNYIRQPH